MKYPVKYTIIAILQAVSQEMYQVLNDHPSPDLSLAVSSVLDICVRLRKLVKSDKWDSLDVLPKEIINEQMERLPDPEAEARKRLIGTVDSQYQKISKYIENSFELDKPPEDVPYSNACVDSFHMLDQFLDIYLGLLEKLPKSVIGKEVCSEFVDVFNNLVMEFVNLITENIGSP